VVLLDFWTLIRDASADTTNKIIVNDILGAVNVSAWGGLEAAVTAIGATKMGVCITSTQTLTGDLTIPSTLALEIKQGGSIDLNGYTLTINGPFKAGLYQVFSGDGSVLIEGEVFIDWWGFSDSASGATNTAAFNKAVASNRTVVINSGTYSVSPLTITNKAKFQIIGHGNVILQCSTGEACLTLGDAEHATRVCKMVMENITFSGSGALTYGIQLLFATDIAMYNVRILDTVNIDTGMYVDYSWNNNFYNTQIECKNALKSGSNNPNNNNFYGGRLRGADNTTDTGITFLGAANFFSGLDISHFKYGVILMGNAQNNYLNNYFEGNGTNDFNFSERAGNAEGSNIIGNLFRGPGGTTSIDSTSGAAQYKVNIIGNQFEGYDVGINLTSTANRWVVFNNYFIDVNTNIVNNGSNCMVYDSDTFTIDDVTININKTRSYRLNPGSVSGTVTIDSIANICATKPATIEVMGIGRNAADVSYSFKIYAIVDDNGALETSGEIWDTAGITDIQIVDGDLQVTTLIGSNWNFCVKATIWYD